MTKQGKSLKQLPSEILPIAELKKPEKNVRIHTKLQIVELIRSLKMFGQTRDAVIDEDNTVLIGNGMIQAMWEMGTSEVSCKRLLGLSPDMKVKLMLADNRIYGLGHDDAVVIQELLNGMTDMDIPGFDSEVLEALQVNVEQMEATMRGYGRIPDDESDRVRAGEQIPDTKNIICPHCGESIWLQ